MTRRPLFTAAVCVIVFSGALVKLSAQPGAQGRPRGSTAEVAPPATAPRPDAVDLDAVYRIKEEALQRSQVMDTLWYLTDVHGPRLTNSPAVRAAADWAAGRLRDWGVANVRQEPWGPFGRGWANEKLTANVLTPQPFPMIAFPRAWTPGTAGAVTAEVAVVQVRTDAEMKAWAGKLAGKIVLTAPALNVRLQLTPLARRFTNEELLELESQPVNAGRGRGTRAGGPPNDPAFGQKLMRFLADEGVVATLEPGNGRSDHGAILVSNAPAEYRGANPPAVPPQLIVATEHYNRILRLVEGKVPVRMELNIQNRFVDDTRDAFNLLGDIPGSDKAREVVMLGAHFDSWHAGTGATDNAAGSAVMMEAMRILKATGLPMRRTVRLALWTGEEQGLLGSRAYIKQQFGDPATMTLKPEHATLSAYFNMDNGSGAFRGVYLQGNEAVRPVFATWMAPFGNLGMTTLSIRSTGSTDHVPFDEVGLPGFQFIQDPLEYSTFSHHTNMDLYDRAQADDLMKNAAIVASFVYQAANRDELLPRKALPRPRPRPQSTQ